MPEAKQRDWSKAQRQRTKLRALRLTPEEDAELMRRCEAAGLSVGAYVRMQCLDQTPPRASRRAPVERALLAQLLAQVGKVGGNVHQISRAMNFKEPVTGDAVRAALADFDSLRSAIMEALGRKGE